MNSSAQRFLLSGRTIVSVIAVLLGACLTGLTIPQVTERSPAYFYTMKEQNPLLYFVIDFFHLNRVFTSVWFMVLVSAVLMLLVYGTILQTRALLCLKRKRQKIGMSGIDPEHDSIMRGISGYFSGKGYRLSSLTKNNSGDDSGEASISMSFTKNTVGRWGSIIFHTGLILVILASLVTFAFQKRGLVQVIRGDTFLGRSSDFLVKNMGVFINDFDIGFRTYLESFNHEYFDGGKTRHLSSSIVAIDESGRSDHAVISANQPFQSGDVRVCQSNSYGYTLSFAIDTKDGRHIVTYFNLDMPAQAGRPLIGKTDFPETLYLFDMRFYPDISKQSMFASDPLLHLTIEKWGTVLFSGDLTPGQRIRIRDDILTFTEVREWSGLIYASNPGIGFVFFSFAVSIAGLVIMFGVPYREVGLNIDRSAGTVRVVMSRHTNRYREIFTEETETMMNEIRSSFIPDTKILMQQEQGTTL